MLSRAEDFQVIKTKDTVGEHYDMLLCFRNQLWRFDASPSPVP